nr:class I SAM-dependent methyltransferase [uncultured Rhodopila sp.]
MQQAAPGVFQAPQSPPHAPAIPWSAAYWDMRYRRGGHSGAGSSGHLAQFKADIVNRIVRRHGIASVIEYGCGDGRQLQLARYPGSYVGLDVSPEAVRLCSERFSGDPGKRFLAASEDPGTADLVLSLDVIFHLVEDETFHRYMRQLFDHALRFVVIYSSDYDAVTPDAHVRHRRFSGWIREHAPDWQRVLHIPNPYPFDPRAPDDTSFADFHVYAHG